MTTKTLFNTSEAAEYLAVSQAFLERDRWAGAIVPFIRIGARAVRYHISDLNAFIAARRTAGQSSARGADAPPSTREVVS